MAAVLAAAVLIAYLPAVNGGRLLDDDLHITAPALRSVAGLGRIWFDLGATQQYYPVLHTAFWVEHRLWGDRLAGYHLANVFLHVGCALLIVALMRRLRLPGAWLAAFLFALHPVCVESVAWIAEQKNTLSTVFALGAAVAYLDFDASRRPSRYGLAVGLFALALLSKTAVVTLPLILAAMVWWRRPSFDWRRDAAPLLPWLALGAVMGLVTLSVERGLLLGVSGDFALGPVARCLVAGRAFWFYVGKLVWPAGLTFFYPRWTIDPGAAWQYLYPFAAAAVAAGCGLLVRRTRGPLAAFLCFAGALLPVLGLFDVEWFVFSYVADHLQYLASIALVVPASAAAAAVAGRLPSALSRIAPAGAGVLVAALAAFTWRQCGRYADPETFYRVAETLNPASAAAYNSLGTVLAAEPGRDAEAIAQFEEALRINPRVAEGQENLGSVLLRDPARLSEAAVHLEAARDIDPGRKSARDKLAYAYSRLPGRLPDAIAEYRASLRIDSSDADVHNSLGLALAQSPGGLADAIAEFEEALRLNPNSAAAHNNLGLAWTLVPGRLNDAIGQFEEALRLNPDFAPAWRILGISQLRAGNYSGAAAAFRRELRLSPGDPAALQGLAEALQQTGNR